MKSFQIAEQHLDAVNAYCKEVISFFEISKQAMIKADMLKISSSFYIIQFVRFQPANISFH